MTTGPDGTATLTGLPVDSYEVTEVSVPDPYVVAAEPTQKPSGWAPAMTVS